MSIFRSHRTFRLARCLIAAVEDKITLLARKYALTEDQIRRFLTLDPTGGSYLEWLTRQYRDSYRGYPVHTYVTHYGPPIREALKIFQAIKKSPTLARELDASPDINRYDVESLLNLTSDAYNYDLTPKRQKEKQFKQQGARVIYDKPPMKIIQIGGEGVSVDAASLASCAYARGTQWCVSDSPTAAGYLAHGPLMLILRDNQKMALYYPTSGALKDIQDHDLILWEPKNRDIVTTLIDAGVDMPADMVDTLQRVGYTLTPKLKQILRDEEDFRSSLLGGGA